MGGMGLVRRSSLAMCLGLLLVASVAQSALGYTFAFNNYPGQPVGCTNVSP
jgi:hypothetical protein